VPVTAGTGLADPSKVLPSLLRQETTLDFDAEPGAVPQLATVPMPQGVPTEADAEGCPAAGIAVLAGIGGSMVVVEALHRAAAAVRHHVENAVLRGSDLSWTGYAVLTLTCQERSVETRAAAAAIGISRGTLTGVVRTLESKSLIRRVPHCRDGRLVLLEPTTSGRRLSRRLAPRVTAAEDYAIGCLDAAERDALAVLLGRLVADLNLDGRPHLD
jgi:DNA-binding MarR family transcriptional regulator